MCFIFSKIISRSIQKCRDPQFVCKSGGGCEVTVKTRRRCQKCRYDLCLEAGMRPEAVLDDGQKKVRFRKMIRKQKREAKKMVRQPGDPLATLQGDSCMSAGDSPSSSSVEAPLTMAPTAASASASSAASSSSSRPRKQKKRSSDQQQRPGDPDRLVFPKRSKKQQQQQQLLQQQQQLQQVLLQPKVELQEEEEGNATKQQQQQQHPPANLKEPKREPEEEEEEEEDENPPAPPPPVSATGINSNSPPPSMDQGGVPASGSLSPHYLDFVSDPVLANAITTTTSSGFVSSSSSSLSGDSYMPSHLFPPLPPSNIFDGLQTMPGGGGGRGRGGSIVISPGGSRGGQETRWYRIQGQEHPGQPQQRGQRVFHIHPSASATSAAMSSSSSMSPLPPPLRPLPPGMGREVHVATLLEPRERRWSEGDSFALPPPSRSGLQRHYPRIQQQPPPAHQSPVAPVIREEMPAPSSTPYPGISSQPHQPTSLPRVLPSPPEGVRFLHQHQQPQPRQVVVHCQRRPSATATSVSLSSVEPVPLMPPPPAPGHFVPPPAPPPVINAPHGGFVIPAAALSASRSSEVVIKEDGLLSVEGQSTRRPDEEEEGSDPLALDARSSRRTQQTPASAAPQHRVRGGFGSGGGSYHPATAVATAATQTPSLAPLVPTTTQYISRKRQLLSSCEDDGLLMPGSPYAEGAAAAAALLQEEAGIRPKSPRTERRGSNSSNSSGRTKSQAPVNKKEEEILDVDDDDDEEEDSDEEMRDEEEDATVEEVPRSVLECSYLNFESLEREPVELVTMPPGFSGGGGGLGAPLPSSSSSRQLQAPTASGRYRKRMMAYLKGVKRAWQFACIRMLGDPRSPERHVVKSLVSCHLGYTALTRPSLREHLVRLARLLRHFALLQPEFAELSRHDQRQLLRRNVPLFLQFVLGRYLSAETPAEQVEWLVLGDHDGRAYRELVRGGGRVDFDLLNASAGLLDDEGSATKYEELLRKMRRRSRSVTRESVPLVALSCLFRTRFTEHMDDAEAADDHAQYILTHAQWAHEVYGSASAGTLERTAAALEEMSELFEGSVRWDGEGGDSLGYLRALRSELCPSMTAEEDLWVQRQFDEFSDTFRAVSYGEDMLKTGLLYHQNTDGSKTATLDPSFGQKFLLTLQERFRRILNTHEEFSGDMSRSKVVEVNMRNVPDAVAVCLAKVESFETGYEQFRFSLGDTDAEMLEGRCRPALVGGGEIAKVTIREVNAAVGALDAKTVDRFEELVGRLSDRLGSVEDFKLAVMILLFAPPEECAMPAPPPPEEGGPPMPPPPSAQDSGLSGQAAEKVLSAVRARYLRCFSERGRMRGESWDLQPLLRDVKEMSAILLRYTMESQRIMTERMAAMMMQQQQQQQQ